MDSNTYKGPNDHPSLFEELFSKKHATYTYHHNPLLNTITIHKGRHFQEPFLNLKKLVWNIQIEGKVCWASMPWLWLVALIYFESLCVLDKFLHLNFILSGFCENNSNACEDPPNFARSFFFTNSFSQLSFKNVIVFDATP